MKNSTGLANNRPGVKKGMKAPAPKKTAEKFGDRTQYAVPAKTKGIMPGQSGKK